MNGVEYFGERRLFFTRTYKLEIRLIQVAIGLALIVLIAGFLGLWGQSSQTPLGTTGTESNAPGSDN